MLRTAPAATLCCFICYLLLVPHHPTHLQPPRTYALWELHQHSLDEGHCGCRVAALQQRHGNLLVQLPDCLLCMRVCVGGGVAWEADRAGGRRDMVVRRHEPHESA